MSKNIHASEINKNMDYPSFSDDHKTEGDGNFLFSIGHHYGNFRNYYNFHPITDRIEILDYTNNNTSTNATKSCAGRNSAQNHLARNDSVENINVSCNDNKNDNHHGNNKIYGSDSENKADMNENHNKN